jgi:hypothetical protein
MVDDFYTSRIGVIPPLPWPTSSPLFSKRLGWNVISKCAVLTGIVIANRAVHDASLNEHPIL